MRIIIGSVLKFLDRLNKKKRELKVDDKTEMLICCMSFKTISDANQSPLLFEILAAIVPKDNISFRDSSKINCTF